MLLDKDRLGIPYRSGWMTEQPGQWMQRVLRDNIERNLFEVRAAICSNRLDTNLLGGGPAKPSPLPGLAREALCQKPPARAWDSSRTVWDGSKLSHACLRRSMLRTFRGTR